MLLPDISLLDHLVLSRAVRHVETRQEFLTPRWSHRGVTFIVTERSPFSYRTLQYKFRVFAQQYKFRVLYYEGSRFLLLRYPTFFTNITKTCTKNRILHISYTLCRDLLFIIRQINSALNGLDWLNFR